MNLRPSGYEAAFGGLGRAGTSLDALSSHAIVENENCTGWHVIASFFRQKGAVEGLKNRPMVAAWLTVPEVARRLKLSKATVYKLVEIGELRSHRIRNSIRIEEFSLDEIGKAPASAATVPALASAVATTTAPPMARPIAALSALEAWAEVEE